MEQFREALAKYCNAKKAANNSSSLIWRPVFCLEHFPPVLQKLPVMDASEKSTKSGFAVKKDFRLPDLNVEPTSSGLSWHPPLELFLPLNFLLPSLNGKCTNSGYSED
jgi:hypothetical protein